MGVQDKHRNLLSSIAIFLLICLFVSQAIASHPRVCSQTRYRRIVLQPVSTLAYTRRSRTVYTSCGFLWLSRCSSVSYYSASTTAYRSRYGAETYKHLFCCSNFIGTPPNCVAKACSRPVDPANGDVAYSSNIHNSIARYTCNLGYQRQGSASQRCQANGHWSGSQPTCEIVHCPRPSGPSNGNVSYTSTVFGSSATFTCNSGYERVGPPSRTCQSYGQWNGTQPFCLPVICPSPSQPSNGDVSYSSLTYQSIALYSCSLAYKLIGPVTRTCQPNKMWSATDPTCQRKTCPELSDPANGEVEVPSMFMGDIATYRCSYIWL